jgi:Rhs_assc_core: RHS repeat-associated core domain
MEDRWNTDTERRDMTVWLFDEESFVPVAMLKEGRSYSILTDQLGTPTEAYDAEGNEVWSRVLDMDGNVIGETGNKGMVPFLFQGQYYDRETGLAYNRFRYYSPKMGMYVSQDPIGLAGGILNLYGYVSDTNVWTDVFGLAGTGGAYMFGFKNGEMYIGKGEIDRMNESIGERRRQVQNPQLIGAAHVSTHGNNELGKMVEYKAMKNAGFERGDIPSNYLNTYLSGETAWNANPSLRAEATELADKLKADFDADVERRRRNSY